MENFASGGRLLVADGQGPDPQASVADLIPVVMARRPPLLGPVDFEARRKTLLDDRPAKLSALVLGPGVKEPVIAN